MTLSSIWTVSAKAVRSWQRLMLRDPGWRAVNARCRQLPANLEIDEAAVRDVNRARAWLTYEVVRVQERYDQNPAKVPQQRAGHPHLYVYRGGLPLRLRLLVDPEIGEVVDVLSLDGGRNATRSEQRRRRS